MSEMGSKIAKKRKDIGLTQIDFAERLSVTRQTVSRWEAGTVMPDIDKVADIAELLGVSCDYLLRDGVEEEDGTGPAASASRLLKSMQGKRCRFAFFDEEADPDLFNAVCTILDFEGSWVKVSAVTRKGHIEKLLPVSSILSLEILGEEE